MVLTMQLIEENPELLPNTIQGGLLRPVAGLHENDVYI